MAVFDSNLMLRSTTQTVSSLIATGVGLYTGAWTTMGTGGGPVDGYSFRTSIQTSAGSNTDSMNLIFETSDDQTVVKETITRNLTGTELGSGTSGGALQASIGDVYTRFSTKRTWIRLRIQVLGLNNNFGLVTCGLDGGDFAPIR